LNPITSAVIQKFLKQLGNHSLDNTIFYLLGGSALTILGNTRQTLDIDYTTNLSGERQKEFELLADKVGNQLHLDVEAVPIEEFIPLPPDAVARSMYIGKYGKMDVFLFDLYTITLSKISRGFESDIEDVLFLLGEKFIDFEELERYYQAIFPEFYKTDIDPKEFKQYFGEVKKRYLK
jgi:hypothetical protein